MKIALYTFPLLLVFGCITLVSSAQWKKGQRVEVNVSAHWYKADVLEVNGDKFKVHYDGYPRSDDAWVHKTQMRTLTADGSKLKVACTFGPPPGNFTNQSQPSDALFKKEVYEYYAIRVTGGLSSPTAVGIVFNTFTRQSAYSNTVTNLPGRGATLTHSGAPANTTIYPVQATFFVCERYKDGSTDQKEVTCDFSFFHNKDGEWTCSKDN